MQISEELRSMRDTGTIYLLEHFLSQDAPSRLFYKTDTHPSQVGQKLIFDFVLRSFGKPTDYDYTEAQREFIGDLGSKFTPPIKEEIIELTPELPPGKLTDNVTPALKSGGHLTGSWLHFKGEDRGRGKIYLFGTSTAYYMRNFFLSHFDEVLFTWSCTIDPKLLKDFSPNYVAGIITERFLGNSQGDMTFKASINMSSLQ